ncbi:hypothetical protein ABMA27_015739 [Loxostege sticticalis]|uniref:Gag protein n=1 Tax=Loxostege sticticalis TaxID=481309 RepID=A0ABR3I441_LOXSC
MEAQLRLPTPIDLQRENLNDEWQRFQQDFKIYMLAAGMDAQPENRKIALLLNLIGTPCYDIYNTFEKSDQQTLKQVLTEFEKHFTPKKNIIFERFRFNQIVQKPGQSADSFITLLKTASASCEFTDKDDQVRDRIVFGILCRSTQELLLREPALTLQRAIEICKSAEVTTAQFKEMTTATITQVEAITQKKERIIKNCTRCGMSHPAAACPAYGKECERCKKKGHFRKCCKTKLRRNIEAVEKQIYCQ